MKCLNKHIEHSLVRQAANCGPNERRRASRNGRKWKQINPAGVTKAGLAEMKMNRYEYKQVFRFQASLFSSVGERRSEVSPLWSIHVYRRSCVQSTERTSLFVRSRVDSPGSTSIHIFRRQSLFCSDSATQGVLVSRAVMAQKDRRHRNYTLSKTGTDPTIDKSAIVLRVR